MGFLAHLNRANECTAAAFVGITAFVLSALYRKKRTRIECTRSFWKKFWKYVTEADDVTDDVNKMIFNEIYCHFHTAQPSHIVSSFLTKILDDYFHEILVGKHHCTKYDLHKRRSILLKHLEAKPLRILVPLCGSSYDMHFISYLLRTKYGLHSKLFTIIGIESSSTAITHFFTRNNMVYQQSSYNPKLFYFADFYRVSIYRNVQSGISIIENDLFFYFNLSQALKTCGIAPSPCFIGAKSIDIIVDINAMSCCNPSDRKQYAAALKYWLNDKGSILLNTYCYDPKLSNYPPFACHPNAVGDLFKNTQCKLVQSSVSAQGKHDMNTVCHSWHIKK